MALRPGMMHFRRTLPTTPSTEENATLPENETVSGNQSEVNPEQSVDVMH